MALISTYKKSSCLCKEGWHEFELLKYLDKYSIVRYCKRNEQGELVCKSVTIPIKDWENKNICPYIEEKERYSCKCIYEGRSLEPLWNNLRKIKEAKETISLITTTTSFALSLMGNTPAFSVDLGRGFLKKIVENL